MSRNILLLVAVVGFATALSVQSIKKPAKAEGDFFRYVPLLKPSGENRWAIPPDLGGKPVGLVVNYTTGNPIEKALTFTAMLYVDVKGTSLTVKGGQSEFKGCPVGGFTASPGGVWNQQVFDLPEPGVGVITRVGIAPGTPAEWVRVRGIWVKVKLDPPQSE